MVFLSAIRFVCKTGKDKSLGRQKIFRLTGKFAGRERNCYRIAIRAAQRELLCTTKARKLVTIENHELKISRLEAACAEHDTSYGVLTVNLVKCNIHLNAEVLTDLAIWEPRTFKCLTEIARMKSKTATPEHVSRYLSTPDTIVNKDSL